ncbi:MAG: molybdopterin-dependent oxidoreductase [Allorhizobium sp.]
MPADVRTTCPYCGVGCGVIASVDAAGAVAIKGDPDHPANFGRLCSKGAALGETLDLSGRVLTPMIEGKSASWDSALDRLAAQFAETITQYGPDSVAFYVSGQLLTEDYYVANKLMKGFIGSANIDTNSRLCMASSVAGHRRAFGADTVPGCYEDLEQADLVILTGSNLAWCHPVIYQRIAAAKKSRPSMKVVLIDPRRTMTADIADLHLAIRADGDVALFNGLLTHLASSSAYNRDYVARFTKGLPAALEAARERMIGEIVAETGLTEAELHGFYRLFETREKTVTCYSQGVNQSSIGSDKVNAIINCHLITGRIGRPGMGPFSLTGQPNAMGGREVGGLANALAAHMEIDNEDDRDRVQRFWQSPRLAEATGLKAVDMFEAVGDGRIKALWIMSTNPVVSMPDADRVRSAIRDCPFVVVSDIQGDTDTARLADVLLPATGWGEKDGTVTNSERRISRQRGFLPAPGEARSDWWQMAEVGRRMGFAAAFDYAGPAEIFAEHARLSGFENRGDRDFDIGAYADIDADGFAALKPFQWPQPAGRAGADSRFFAEGHFFHPDRKARFIATRARAPRRVSADYPFILNTGRVRDHWHTMTRTGKTARLSGHIAEPFVELHPDDAETIGVCEADLVTLESPHGSIVVRALITARQARGSLFVPMHWTDEFSARGRVDTLVPPAADPVSGQPASKHCAVRAVRFAARQHGFVVSRAKPTALDLDYWALARADGGWRLEFAASVPVENFETWCRTHFSIPETVESLGYADRATGSFRLAFFEGDRLLLALFVAEAPVEVSRNWAIGQLSQPADMASRFAVIAGRPAGGRPDPGATVCSCLSVGVNAIAAAVIAGARTVEAIGDQTSAGTNCGSCRAEIRGIIDACHAAAAE